MNSRWIWRLLLGWLGIWIFVGWFACVESSGMKERRSSMREEQVVILERMGCALFTH
jgi:hypothetical protein